MKKLFVTSLLFLNLITSTFSQSNNNAQSFSLQGKIIGEDAGRIILNYSGKDSKWVQDTVPIKNGEFVFKGNIIEPSKAQLNGGNNLNNVEIYLESGIMKIELIKDKFKESKMTGSKSQLELCELNELERPINVKLELLKGQEIQIDDSIKNTSIDSNKHRLEKRWDDIDKLWVKTREELNQVWLQFVLNHPKSYVTPHYLLILEGNEVISLESLKSIFNKLDISIQNSRYGKHIQDDIRKKGNSSIGSMAPDFKAINVLTNKPITYSEFKGKNIVLLEFWASWCAPCRMEIPHLKDLYQKYHRKGFEIIAISKDMNKDSWISAIKQENIENWHNISIAERYFVDSAYLTKDDVNENYFVQAIPLKLLIDKYGKIIGRWSGYNIEYEKDLDNKLAKLFKEN